MAETRAQRRMREHFYEARQCIADIEAIVKDAGLTAYDISHQVWLRIEKYRKEDK